MTPKFFSPVLVLLINACAPTPRTPVVNLPHPAYTLKLDHIDDFWLGASTDSVADVLRQQRLAVQSILRQPEVAMLQIIFDGMDTPGIPQSVYTINFWRGHAYHISKEYIHIQPAQVPIGQSEIMKLAGGIELDFHRTASGDSMGECKEWSNGETKTVLVSLSLKSSSLSLYDTYYMPHAYPR